MAWWRHDISRILSKDSRIKWLWIKELVYGGKWFKWSVDQMTDKSKDFLSNNKKLDGTKECLLKGFFDQRIVIKFLFGQRNGWSNDLIRGEIKGIADQLDGWIG